MEGVCKRDFWSGEPIPSWTPRDKCCTTQRWQSTSCLNNFRLHLLILMVHQWEVTEDLGHPEPTHPTQNSTPGSVHHMVDKRAPWFSRADKISELVREREVEERTFPTAMALWSDHSDWWGSKGWPVKVFLGKSGIPVLKMDGCSLWKKIGLERVIGWQRFSNLYKKQRGRLSSMEGIGSAMLH